MFGCENGIRIFSKNFQHAIIRYLMKIEEKNLIVRIISDY